MNHPDGTGDDAAFLAELRVRCEAREAAREPLTDEEALARWTDAGRVMLRRFPELFRCTLDVAESNVAGLGEARS